MKINSNDIFFTCSLIELIGRNTLRKRSDVVSLLGKKNIAHIYAHADTLHCEPIAKTADTFIELCKITKGDFDNVAACKYAVPEYWAIGKVYARLIEDVHDGDDVVETLLNVYKSPISDMISNYNSDLFYQSRGFIKEFFLSNGCEFEDRNDHCPAIRFRGFTDAWEQRELGEIVERIVRKNTNLESTLPLTISAQYGLVDQITYFNNRVASRDISGYYLVLNGEFAYNKSTSDGFPFGAIKRLDLYPKGVLSTLYIVFSIRDRRQTSSDYLTVFFDTDRWHRGVSERAAEGARNHGLLNISAEDFFDISICLPKGIREQEKIGMFFRKLDHLITLHQRKLDKLTKVKKSMLQKMFPQNGSANPEIRFSGFTNAWEQRKLGDITRKTYGGGTPKTSVDEYWGGSIPWIQSSNLTEHQLFDAGVQKYITEAGLQKSATQLVPKNSIAVVSHVGVGKLVFMPFEYTTSQDFISLSELSIDPVFACYVIYKKLQEDVHIVQGSAIKGITKDALLNKEISVPKKEEQTAIGTVLQNLDDLITLHQRKLEKLKKIKASCLEKMFV